MLKGHLNAISTIVLINALVIGWGVNPTRGDQFFSNVDYSLGAINHGTNGSINGGADFSYHSEVTGDGFGLIVDRGEIVVGDIFGKASLDMVARNGVLGLLYEGTTNAEPIRFGPTVQGNVSVSWMDSFQLLARTPGITLPPGMDLIFRAKVEGAVADRLDPPITQPANKMFFSSFLGNQQFGENHDPLDGIVEFNSPISAKVAVGAHGAGNISYGFGIQLNTATGLDIADFGDTMKLESITFADGTTPESRGYDIVFASGMGSPNISAVPEPDSASLLLLGTGVIFVVVRASKCWKGDVRKPAV
jgi:hypothetical protein